MTLRIERLGKKFGDVVAVNDVSLEADDKDFLVLLGPSGSGKSTTLRCVAGLEQPTGGDIFIEENRVNNLEPADRNIAMVFQNYALYPHMSVRQNMGLALEVSGIPDDQVEQSVTEAAEILDISELLDRNPSELSGGQQQRAALGRAIVRDPDVFLMDEPLSNLDAKLRMQMRKELEELHKRLGTTFVYVTHDQVEAMTMATKIAVLHEGELQQVGTPEELYDEPTNEFVAGFIGEPPMNFIDGTVIRNDTGTSVQFDGFEYRLSDECADVVETEELDSVRMGIRPEDIILSDSGEYEAEINVVEPTGSNAIVYIEIGGVELTVLVERDGTLKRQSVAGIDIPQDNVHLFSDGETLI